ncbi:hypothetical protein BDF19DRAFT_453260 [Syncephalis fuscata]|nr:hypothetical protein BDF19DRAFT_453260 [Syncephalis fuscata]
MLHDIALVPAHTVGAACYFCVLVLVIVDIFRNGLRAYWSVAIFALVRTLSERCTDYICGIATVIGTVLLTLALHKFLHAWHTSVIGTSRDANIEDNRSIISDMDGDGSSRQLRWTINGLRFLTCVFTPIGIAGSINNGTSNTERGFGLTLTFSWGYFVIFCIPFYLCWLYWKMSREWPRDLIAGKTKVHQLTRIIIANSLLVIGLFSEALRNSIRSMPMVTGYLGMVRAIFETTGIILLIWPGFFKLVDQRMLYSSSLSNFPAMSTAEMAMSSEQAPSRPSGLALSRKTNSVAGETCTLDSRKSGSKVGSPRDGERKQKPKLQLSEKEKGGLHPMIGHDGATVIGSSTAGGGASAFGGTEYAPYVISYDYKKKQEKKQRQLGVKPKASPSNLLLSEPSSPSSQDSPKSEEQSYEQEVLLHQQRYAEQRRFFAEANRLRSENSFEEGYGYSESSSSPRRQIEHRPSQASLQINTISSRSSSRTSQSPKYKYNFSNSPYPPPRPSNTPPPPPPHMPYT